MSCSSSITLPGSLTQGENGADGKFGGFSTRFTFNGTTSNGTSSGQLRFNNSTLASVTKLFCNDTNADALDVDAFLDSFDNSSSFGLVRVFKEFSNTVFWVGKVTAVVDSGTEHEITVTHILSNGTFTAGDSLVLSFSPSGVTPSALDQLAYVINSNAGNTFATSGTGSPELALNLNLYNGSTNIIDDGDIINFKAIFTVTSASTYDKTITISLYDNNTASSTTIYTTVVNDNVTETFEVNLTLIYDSAAGKITTLGTTKLLGNTVTECKFSRNNSSFTPSNLLELNVYMTNDPLDDNNNMVDYFVNIIKKQ